MKGIPKEPDRLWTFPKLMVFLVIFLSLVYIFYSLGFINHSYSCDPRLSLTRRHSENLNNSTQITHNSLPPSLPTNTSFDSNEPTNLSHIVFGIASSSKLWKTRKEYIKQWWIPNEMRGFVYLDKAVEMDPEEDTLLPTLMISSNTSHFTYKNPRGDRSAIRITRIVSEMKRLNLEGVRWFVMGDDDTFFVVDNLVKVLKKYDHNQPYYIGANSESHIQNMYFSYNMAYGGAGFAISHPLANELEKMQDRCIPRYPSLYGSDDRIQACLAELGVPLSKELGFHQCDLYGDIYGLLASHPVAPLVSIHHLDLLAPIFPNMNRVQALQHLKISMKLDPYGIAQQSICYEKHRKWTVSVSWGFAVQITRGIISPREMEMPPRTFYNWYKRADYTGFSFNTRPVNRHICQKPFVYYLTNATLGQMGYETISEYFRNPQPNPECKWKMEDPTKITHVEVYKRLNPHLWDKSPRRNCCRFVNNHRKDRMVIQVGECRENEVAES